MKFNLNPFIWLAFWLVLFFSLATLLLADTNEPPYFGSPFIPDWDPNTMIKWDNQISNEIQALADHIDTTWTRIALDIWDANYNDTETVLCFRDLDRLRSLSTTLRKWSGFLSTRPLTYDYNNDRWLDLTDYAALTASHQARRKALSRILDKELSNWRIAYQLQFMPELNRNPPLEDPNQ